MSRTIVKWAVFGAALLGVALVVPASAAAGAPPALLMGGSLGATLGCMACAGAALYAVASGVGLAALLWTSAGLAKGVACITVCGLALTT